MRVYMLYMRDSRSFAEMVFETKDAIDLYIQTYGNPKWEVVPVELTSVRIVNLMIERDKENDATI